jgi:hypothetical protein
MYSLYSGLYSKKTMYSAIHRTRVASRPSIAIQLYYSYTALYIIQLYSAIHYTTSDSNTPLPSPPAPLPPFFANVVSLRLTHAPMVPCSTAQRTTRNGDRPGGISPQRRQREPNANLPRAARPRDMREYIPPPLAPPNMSPRALETFSPAGRGTSQAPGIVPPAGNIPDAGSGITNKGTFSCN